jgi:hypothetical protein
MRSERENPSVLIVRSEENSFADIWKPEQGIGSLAARKSQLNALPSDFTCDTVLIELSGSPEEVAKQLQQPADQVAPVKWKGTQPVYRYMLHEHLPPSMNVNAVTPYIVAPKSLSDAVAKVRRSEQALKMK